MRKIIDLALAGANAAAARPLFRAMLLCTLVCSLIGGSPAIADSKSSAEFTLRTCLAAMDDLAKVEAIARKNNWTAKTPPNSAALRNVTSRSMWEVMEGEDNFTVTIWTSHIGENLNLPPQNVCWVMFPGNILNREEFFNLISASVELMFISDTRFPQARSELYEVKSDRITKLGLSIMSRSDGTLMSASLQQFPSRQITPPARN
jgi:hypothetical protein